MFSGGSPDSKRGANVRTNVVAANDDIIESADTLQPQKTSVPVPNIRHFEKPPSGPPGPKNMLSADIHSVQRFSTDTTSTGDAQSTVVGVDVHPVGATDMQKAVTIKPPNGSSNGTQNVQARQPVIPGLASGTTTGSMSSTSQMPKKQTVPEISPIVIAPLGEPATATTNVLQNVFQQKQITTGSVVKSTVDKVFQTASTTNVPGKNTAHVILTAPRSSGTSGQQSSLILNAPQQNITLSTPPAVQGYEAKVVPRMTPRPSATIGPRFTPGTQSAVSKQITPTPILQGPRTPAQPQNTYVAPGSILQNEVMSQLLANPTTAMATFLTNSSGSAITTAKPPNAISQLQAPLFPTGTDIPGATLPVTSLVAPTLPVTSLVASTLPTLNAVSSLNVPPILPLLNTQIPAAGLIPFQGPQQGSNTAIITSGPPISGMNSTATAGQTLSVPQALSQKAVPASTSLPFGSIYPSQVASASNSPFGRPTNDFQSPSSYVPGSAMVKGPAKVKDDDEQLSSTISASMKDTADDTLSDFGSLPLSIKTADLEGLESLSPGTSVCDTGVKNAAGEIGDDPLSNEGKGTADDSSDPDPKRQKLTNDTPGVEESLPAGVESMEVKEPDLSTTGSYKCTICDQKLETGIGVIFHSLVHSAQCMHPNVSEGEQDFRDVASDCACPFCSETFSDKEISLSHQSEVHQVDPADFKGTEIVTFSENIMEDSMDQLKVIQSSETEENGSKNQGGGDSDAKLVTESESSSQSKLIQSSETEENSSKNQRGGDSDAKLVPGSESSSQSKQTVSGETEGSCKKQGSGDSDVKSVTGSESSSKSKRRKKMRQPHGGKENYSLPVDDAGASDHQCPVCKKNFGSKFVLLTHKKMMHAETKAFFCDQPDCKVKCATAMRLKLHKQKAHGVKLDSTSPGKTETGGKEDNLKTVDAQQNTESRQNLKQLLESAWAAKGKGKSIAWDELESKAEKDRFSIRLFRLEDHPYVRLDLYRKYGKRVPNRRNRSSGPILAPKPYIEENSALPSSKRRYREAYDMDITLVDGGYFEWRGFKIKPGPISSKPWVRYRSKPGPACSKFGKAKKEITLVDRNYKPGPLCSKRKRNGEAKSKLETGIRRSSTASPTDLIVGNDTKPSTKGTLHDVKSGGILSDGSCIKTENLEISGGASENLEVENVGETKDAMRISKEDKGNDQKEENKAGLLEIGETNCSPNEDKNSETPETLQDYKDSGNVKKDDASSMTSNDNEIVTSNPSVHDIKGEDFQLLSGDSETLAGFTIRTAFVSQHTSVELKPNPANSIPDEDLMKELFDDDLKSILQSKDAVCSCGYIIPDNIMRTIHKTIHAASNPLKCSVCNVVFENYHKFHEHLFCK